MAIEHALPYLFNVQRDHNLEEIMLDSEWIAKMLVDRVIADGLGVAAVASAIVNAAMGHCTKAQVAVVVVKMVQQGLAAWEDDIATRFQEQVSTLSLAKFFDIWNIIFDTNAQSTSFDCQAVTTLIGDLAFIKCISYDKFKLCLGVLLDNFSALSDLVCIGSLIKKATAASDFRKEPNFLMKCILKLQGRCRRLFGIVSDEESLIVALLQRVLFKKEVSIPADYATAKPIPFVTPPPFKKTPRPSSSYDSGSSSSSSSSSPDLEISLKWPIKAKLTWGLVTLPPRRKSKMKDDHGTSRQKRRVLVEPLSEKRYCCQFSYGTSPPPEELPPLAYVAEHSDGV